MQRNFDGKKNSAEIRVSNLFRPKPKLESVSAEIIWIFAPLLCRCWALTNKVWKNWEAANCFSNQNNCLILWKWLKIVKKVSNILSKAMRNILLNVNCVTKRSHNLQISEFIKGRENLNNSYIQSFIIFSLSGQDKVSWFNWETLRKLRHCFQNRLSSRALYFVNKQNVAFEMWEKVIIFQFLRLVNRAEKCNIW